MMHVLGELGGLWDSGACVLCDCRIVADGGGHFKASAIYIYNYRNNKKLSATAQHT